MNDRSLDQLLDAWMDLGPTSAPDRVADAARLEALSTRQTAIPPWWPPRRFLEMNNIVRVGLVAAAVVTAALLGYSYFIAPNVGWPTVFPSEPTPEPSISAVDFTDLEGGGTPLEPGAHRIDYAAPVGVIVTIPDEAYLGYPSAWYKARYDWGPWHQTNSATLGIMDIQSLSFDPCASGFGPDEDTGTGVDELADALERVNGIEIARSDASLDGYNGQLLEITGSERSADCVAEPYLWLTTRGEAFPAPDVDPDSSVRVWILDVEGHRLVVVASSADPLYADDLQDLVDSLQIEAP